MAVKQKTWRYQTVNLSAGVAKEVTFFDTSPNLLVIQNKNSSDAVYIGFMSNVSTTENFEMSIVALSTRKYGCVQNIVKMYFISASDCEVGLGSVEVSDIQPSDISQDQTSVVVYNSASSSNVNIVSEIPAGTKKIGNVGITGEIPAGTKTIGNIIITDGVDVMVINADGSINTQSILGAGTNVAGKFMLSDASGNAVGVTNNKLDVNMSGATINATISDVGITDGTDNLVIESNGSINVNALSLPSLPAGTNDLGKVHIVDSDSEMKIDSNGNVNTIINTITSGQCVKPCITPHIYNITCTNANTEYSMALPSSCKSFTIGLKSKLDSITWELAFETSATETFEFLGNESYSQDNLHISSQTLFFKCSLAGEVIQIIAWN
jgi:hypothetical protein